MKTASTQSSAPAQNLCTGKNVVKLSCWRPKALAHRDIHDAQTGLKDKIGQIGSKKYHAGAGCQHGHAATTQSAQGLKKAFLLHKFAHDRALASGQNQPLHALQILKCADFAHVCAALRKSLFMFAKSPLQGQNAYADSHYQPRSCMRSS